MVGEGGGGGGSGGGGGGVKILWPLSMTPPPCNCRIQDVTSLALLVHLSGLFISFYFHAFTFIKTFVVGEGGGGGGGGQNIMAIIICPPPPTAEYKMLPR